MLSAMNRRAFMLATSAAWLSARIERARAGACAGGLSEIIVTPNGARIGRGGGVVTLVTSELGLARGGGARVFTLTRDTAEAPVRQERIAPGLVRFVPEAHEVGAYTVQSSFGAIALVLVDTPAETPPACDVTRVVLNRGRMQARGRTMPRYTLVATHRRPPPETAHYVIVRDASTAEPLMSAVLGHQSRTTTLFETPGECVATVPGTTMPTPGRAITLAYVNQIGVVGPSTPRIVVR